MNWIDKPIEKVKPRRRFANDEERKAARKAAQKKYNASAKRYQSDRKAMPHNSAGDYVHVPDYVAQARDSMRALEHTSLTAFLLGDPLPGRSELDKRKGN